MPQPDSDDEFPDDISHLDLSNVPGLQEFPVSSSVRTLEDPAVPASLLSQSSVPSEYDCDEEIDESILAACDAIEAQFTQNRNRPQNQSAVNSPDRSMRLHPTDQFTTQQVIPTQIATAALNSVSHLDARKRGPPSPEPSPTSKKGRTTEDGIHMANSILKGFEAEIDCPICYDVLVAAHLCNPCGHSCCGECVQGWISRNKKYPTCAVCRTALSTSRPVIPNYTLDGIAWQYIRALAINGRLEWQEKGEKLAEWNKRHEKWRRLVAISKAQADAAKEKKDARRGVPHLPLAGRPYMHSVFERYLVDDDEDDEDDEDEDPTYEQDEPVEVLPRRAMLSRQRTIVSSPYRSH